MRKLTLFVLLVFCLPVYAQLDGYDSIKRRLDNMEIDMLIERMERDRQKRVERNELPPINVPLPTTCDLYYINNKFSYLGERYDFIRAQSWVKVTFGKEPLIIYFQENFVDSDASNKNIRKVVLNSSSEIRKLCPGLSKNIFN